MSTFDLASLGITTEELQNRVVERIADQLLAGVSSDEYGEPVTHPTTLRRNMERVIKDRIDAAVAEIGDKFVLPLISEKLETFTLQKTNEWGEKKAAPVTFIEYLVQRAEAYMSEQVDNDGKTQSENRGIYWSGRSTRVAYMIDRHLAYSIEHAMKDALASANSSIGKGLEAAVKEALQRVVTSIKVTTETKTK